MDDKETQTVKVATLKVIPIQSEGRIEHMRKRSRPNNIKNNISNSLLNIFSMTTGMSLVGILLGNTYTKLATLVGSSIYIPTLLHCSPLVVFPICGFTVGLLTSSIKIFNEIRNNGKVSGNLLNNIFNSMILIVIISIVSAGIIFFNKTISFIKKFQIFIQNSYMEIIALIGVFGLKQYREKNKKLQLIQKADSIIKVDQESNISKYKDQILKLTERINTINKRGEAQDKVCKDFLDQLSEENLDLEEFEDINKFDTRLKEKDLEIVKLNKKIIELRDKIDQLREESIIESKETLSLDSKIDDLLQEIKCLKEECSKLKEENIRLREECFQAKSTSSYLTEQNLQRVEDYLSISEELKELKDIHLELSKEYEKVCEEYDNLVDSQSYSK